MMIDGVKWSELKHSHSHSSWKEPTDDETRRLGQWQFEEGCAEWCREAKHGISRTPTDPMAPTHIPGAPSPCHCHHQQHHLGYVWYKKTPLEIEKLIN